MKKNLSDKILKFMFRTAYKPVLIKYLRSERPYNFNTLRLKVFSGVFHPGFFFSTKILLSFLNSFELKTKSFLELGAGSGLISIYAAKKGAIVTASDISQKAIENISVNKQMNHVAIEQIHSDLFDRIPQQVFDFIVINPPYYKGHIGSEADYSWYAGEGLEYFQKLFIQLQAYIKMSTHVFMILSDECDIQLIKSMASANNFELRKIYSKKVLWETNFIFEIDYKN